ncbi:MAG: pyridoxal 5'-phosphate synthase glutaminase subunit PdxT [Chlamydiales bacterium]|nr:pyridoxal 5'-phosphate synthase glutaminase subunit PdxT [Chlamydiales bacterium]
MLTIGVLALQGDFRNHIKAFQKLGVDAIEIRKATDLDKCLGLVIPGGESTCITRQLEFSEMEQSIIAFAKEKPVWGTCAGLILMSKDLFSKGVISLGLLDIKVERNAYGRQKESFEDEIEVQLDSSSSIKFKGVFIRAPQIHEWNPDTVHVLSSYQGRPILVREGNHLGSTFHPELTDDLLIHNYFLSIISSVKK